MPKTLDQLQTQARAANTLVASLRHTLRSTTHVTRAAILNRLALILSRYDHSTNADRILEAIFDDKSKPVQDPRYQHYVDTMITADAKPHSYDAWARVAGKVTPEQRVLDASFAAYTAWCRERGGAVLTFLGWLRVQEIERHAHEMAMDRTDAPSQHYIASDNVPPNGW